MEIKAGMRLQIDVTFDPTFIRPERVAQLLEEWGDISHDLEGTSTKYSVQAISIGGKEMNQAKVELVRGLLIAFASSGQIVDYDEIRRLARLHPTDVGAYLDAARQGLGTDEPDFCAIVVNDSGVPGPGWGNTADASKEIVRSHMYWRDRRFMDNEPFKAKYGILPEIPGIKED